MSYFFSDGERTQYVELRLPRWQTGAAAAYSGSERRVGEGLWNLCSQTVELQQKSWSKEIRYGQFHFLVIVCGPLQ